MIRDMRRYSNIAVAAVLSSVLLGVCACAAQTPANSRVYPGEEWEHVSPEDAGFDARALELFSKYIGGHGCIARGGRLVHSWGRYTNRLDVSSAVKPVYVHLVLKAIEDGLIDSLDSHVADFEPRLSELNAELDHKDSRMTWRHMANQTACYAVKEEPGTAFNYCDRQMALLIDTLVFKVYETGFWNADTAILGPAVSDPLQCQDSPTIGDWGHKTGRLRISPRDFTRFGLLYLAGGRWKDEQVLPREVIERTVSSPLPASLPVSRRERVGRLPMQRSIGACGDGRELVRHMNSYSYAWWVNGIIDDGTRLMPDAPEDAFLAAGHGGHDLLLVLPSLDLVVCWIDAFPGVASGWFYDAGRKRVSITVRRLLQALAADA